jgi:hypothetical protein
MRLLRCRMWISLQEVPLVVHELMMRPGRIVRDSDGQWVPMAGKGGGRLQQAPWQWGKDCSSQLAWKGNVFSRCCSRNE